MTRPIETFDSAAAFLAAQRRATRHAPSSTPRAPSGQGDHLAALMRLAAAGWHFYTCVGDRQWFARSDGTRGPVADSYEAAIAATGEVGR